MRLGMLRADSLTAVIIVARWDSAAARRDLLELEPLVRAVHVAAPGARILLLAQPPMLAIGDQNAPQWLAWRRSHGLPIDSVPVAETAAWLEGRDFVRAFCRDNPGITLVEVDDLYRVGTSRVRAVVGDHVVYTDDDHLSDYGAGMAELRIEAALVPMLHR
jgi:hypothetical protein